MLDYFIIRAILAGVGIALIAGPFGSFVVWKRMAFFGDALAHSALLGIALSFLFEFNRVIGITLIVLMFSGLVVFLQKKRSYASDTLLGVMAHSALAFGLVVISFVDNTGFSLTGFLFGDILAINFEDISYIYIGAILILGLLKTIWQPLLLITVNEDLAKVEGINTSFVKLKFTLALSLLIALSIKIVGVLLVTSLLIIPAATARVFSSTPERMLLLSVFFGILAVISGIYGSVALDTPSGASIVVASSILFLVGNVLKDIKLSVLKP